MEFDVRPGRPLAEGLMPFLRVAVATAEEEARAVDLSPSHEVDEPMEGAVSPANERAALAALVRLADNRLAAYPTSQEEDELALASPSSPRHYEAAKLLFAEKRLLRGLRNAALVDDAILSAAREGLPPHLLLS